MKPMRPLLLRSFLLVGLTLAWAESASAVVVSLSFTDLIDGADIVVGGVPGIGGVPALPVGVPVIVSTSPELATVTFGTATNTSIAISSVALTEPGSSSRVSDLASARVFFENGVGVGLGVSFQSDTETGSLIIPPELLEFATFRPETGLPQIVVPFFSSLLPLVALDVQVTAQSDLVDVAATPEPSTLLLFGSSLLGMGGTWRRYRHR